MEELDLFETLDVICNDKVTDFVWHAIYDSGIDIYDDGELYNVIYSINFLIDDVVSEKLWKS